MCRVPMLLLLPRPTLWNTRTRIRHGKNGKKKSDFAKGGQPLYERSSTRIFVVLFPCQECDLKARTGFWRWSDCGIDMTCHDTHTNNVTCYLLSTMSTNVNYISKINDMINMSGTEPRGTAWLSVTMNRREISWPALPTQTDKVFPTPILSRIETRVSITVASEERKEQD